MNTGIAMRNKEFGIIAETCRRSRTGSSHILAELAIPWSPFADHRLVLNVALPLFQKRALTVIVTKPKYYTKIKNSFRTMNVHLSAASCTQRKLSPRTAHHRVLLLLAHILGHRKDVGIVF